MLVVALACPAWLGAVADRVPTDAVVDLARAGFRHGYGATVVSKPVEDNLHAAVLERLRSGGHLYTSGRRRLVSLLIAVPRPATLPELLAGQADLAQSSVYRNLAVLEEAGIVTRIAGSGEHARFEMAEDLIGHHHHLICTACGRVDDFTVSSAVEQTVDKALARVVKANGFVATAHRLDLLGVCAACHAAR
ncbi:MAG: transcriptional repressor [Acidimicrobiia bacterium]|nr:transcriptional repressor [Acidimicrobiia bacterium]